MKLILFLQTISTLIIYALIYKVADAERGISYLAGSGTILLSFMLMGIGWGMIFNKKLVALSVFVIVFKYAILGVIVFTTVKEPWFRPIWYSVGISSFTITALIFAFIESNREGKKNVI